MKGTVLCLVDLETCHAWRPLVCAVLAQFGHASGQWLAVVILIVAAAEAVGP